MAARVKQIKNLIAETEMDYEKEKLNERVARLSGGVAIIQVSVCNRLRWSWGDSCLPCDVGTAIAGQHVRTFGLRPGHCFAQVAGRRSAWRSQRQITLCSCFTHLCGQASVSV